MPIRTSPAYTSLKPEDMQTPESLTAYFMKDIIGTGYEERQLHLELGGFWFDILNSQISGIEGELMFFSDTGYSKNLALLLRLNQGLYLHPLSQNTPWRKIDEFSSPKQQEQFLAASRRMFDVIDAFETGDYTMKFGSQDFSKPYESLRCYTIDSLALRGQNIPLLHPNPEIQEHQTSGVFEDRTKFSESSPLEESAQQTSQGLTPEQMKRIATHGCGHTI